MSPARTPPAASSVSSVSIHVQSLLTMLKPGSQACETWASGECHRSQPPHSSRPMVFQVPHLLVYPYCFKENPRHCIIILLINTSLCISKRKKLLKNKSSLLQWWLVSVIPAVEKLRQEDPWESEVSFNQITFCRPAWVAVKDSISTNQATNQPTHPNPKRHNVERAERTERSLTGAVHSFELRYKLFCFSLKTLKISLHMN